MKPYVTPKTVDTDLGNLDYRLAIYDAGGQLFKTLQPGDPPEAVFDGEEIRVYAENGDTRAAAVGKSRYQIAFN